MLNPSIHVLKTIYTSHYRYAGPNRIDITVKGKHPDWRTFALHTWDMVMGIKKGTMSESEYIRFYLDILYKVPAGVWDKLLQHEEVVFVCFCNKDSFCHRNILTQVILKTLNGRVNYGGFIL